MVGFGRCGWDWGYVPGDVAGSWVGTALFEDCVWVVDCEGYGVGFGGRVGGGCGEGVEAEVEGLS